MRGAPVLSGSVNSAIGVLDAFLLTGFGAVTALSVTVAGGIATAQLQAGDTFEKHCVVLIAGATPSQLNGEGRVLTATNASISWATTAADGVATGTITIRVAPVGGWEKLFAGTNKAVYRSIDPLGSGFCLRVDDSGTTTLRVRGFESMSDVDTGVGPFPTDAQISGGGWWLKSSVASSAAVRYDLIADSRTLLTAVCSGSPSSATNLASPLRGFGDMLPLRASGDPYACALSCNASSAISAVFGLGSFDRFSNSSDAIFLPRGIGGIGSSHSVWTLSYVGGASATSGADGTLGTFPSAVDGELKFSKRFVKDGATSTPRADVPGLLYIPQSGVNSLVSPRDILPGTGAMAGRLLLALGATSGTPTVAHDGIYLVDITGPWR